MATEADLAIEEARRNIAGGDTEMVRRAAEKAGLLLQAEATRSRPTGLRPVLGWIAAAAAAVLIAWLLWPLEQPPPQQRIYLSEEWIVQPVGPVSTFEVFAIAPSFSDRFRVDYVVYDGSGLQELARAEDQGPQWKPTDEQRAAMRAAGEIQWVVRLTDPLGAPREGRASASWREPGESQD